MPLSAGDQLGPYEILAPLGAGGMGEVYRARDTKLDREVAIKVLPDALALDADRLARFEREAKALAALNHPYIAQIYGVEERALVMELVEGETLSALIKPGPLPIETALIYARQIAEALEAAHEKGIIHRDLKPANVMITHAGVVKVLDFGLAKTAESSVASGNAAHSPTITMSPTQAGMILGTAAYMSPEQARGKTVDRRADIWSFGVVLYEMLTGDQTFTGETVTDILASVVKEHPSLDRLPARVRTIVERCLRKDPRQRWQAIGDVRIEIEALIANPGGAVESEQRAAPRPLRRRAIPVAVAAVLAAAITGIAVWNLKPSARPLISRFAVALGEDQQFSNTGRRAVTISPDGTQMAYFVSRRLYVRPMSEMDARVIAGSENQRDLTDPVFSPDGHSIAYFDAADQALERVAAAGGAPVTICPAGNPWGMSWSSSGIVFGQGSKGILRVSANGGNPEVLAAVTGGELAAHPQMLPGGQAVMFTLATSQNDWDNAKIVVQALKSGARKTLVEGGEDAWYLPTGHLVYFRTGSLLAVPFDLSRLEVTGGPVPIVEGVMRNGAIGAAQFDFSQTGSLIYVPGPSSTNSQYSLVFVDPKGSQEPLKLPPGPYDYLRVSRDGKRLAYQTDDGKEAIVWIYDLSGASAPRRLTFQGANRYPAWSADGERVAFQSDREGDLGIFWQRADGTGTAERLTKPEKGVAHIPGSFSPDGLYLSFTSVQSGHAALWTLSLRDRKAVLFADSPSGNVQASVFSPDGRWIAYAYLVATGSTVFVRAFPVTPGEYQIATPGYHPFWSRDGKQLFFGTGPLTSAAVNVSTERGFTFTTPAPVPRGGLAGHPTGPRSYDVLPDGRTIGRVVPGTNQAGAAQQIQVVLNWFEDVKQRVPGSK